MKRRHRQTGRKRGAPLGTANALKPGLSSKYISERHHRSVDELALARVRLTDCLDRQAAAGPDKWLDFERAVIHYMRLIVSLSHNNPPPLPPLKNSLLHEAIQRYRRECGLEEQ